MDLHKIRKIDSLYFRENDIGIACVKKIRRIIETISFKNIRVGILLKLRYENKSPIIERKSDTVIRFASVDDIYELDKVVNKHDLFKNRFERGDIPVVAIVHGNIVGYEWICGNTRHMHEVYGFLLEIPENTLFTYDAFIIPKYRFRGIWVKFTNFIIENRMMCLGKRYISCLINYENIISMNTHIRFGYEVTDRYIVVKFFNKVFKARLNVSFSKRPDS